MWKNIITYEKQMCLRKSQETMLLSTLKFKIWITCSLYIFLHENKTLSNLKI